MPDSVKGLPLNNLWSPTDLSSINAKRIADSVQRNATGAESSSKTDTSADAEHQKRVKDSAKDFEALLLHQMLESMWSAVPKDGLISGSREEDLYRDMLNQDVAESIASTHSLGIQEQIVSDINRLDKKTK